MENGIVTARRVKIVSAIAAMVGMIVLMAGNLPIGTILLFFGLGFFIGARMSE